MGNGSSTKSSSKSKVHVHTAKVSSNEPSFRYGNKLGSFRGEYNYYDTPNVAATSASEKQHGTNVSSSSLDSDDTFNDYIRRAKSKIRTVSNVGREHGNYSAPAVTEYDVANNGGNNNNNNNNKENQSDQFSEFIQLAKKKLRTTSGVGRNNGSFQRG